MNEETLLDPDVFIRALTIYNKDKRRLDFFELHREQEILLDALQKHDRIIILKARQLGISTLIRGWMFYQAFFDTEPRTYACIAHTHNAAENLHRIDKTYHNNFPIKRKLSKENQTEMVFEDSGAQIRTFTAGGKGGTRSYQLDCIHLSEFAFYEDQEEILATILASAGEGQIIIESTPNVIGDKFHELVMETIETNGENGWKLLFFPWWEHKNYQLDTPAYFQLRQDEHLLKEKWGWTDEQLWWRRKQVNTLGKEKFFREYPADVKEAFRNTGKNYFNTTALDRIEPLKDPKNNYKAIGEPVSGCRYIIGVDCGAGLNQDYSVASIVSLETRQPVAFWWDNNTSPAMFAEKLFDLAVKWNDAQIIVESNNIGQLVLYKLKEFGYPYLWKNEKGKDFLTSKRTRPLLFEILREIIEDGMITRLNEKVIDELRSIYYVNDKPQHPRGGNDDKVIAMALAYYAIKDEPIDVVMNVKETFFEQHKKKQRAKRAKRALPWNIKAGNNKGRY